MQVRPLLLLCASLIVLWSAYLFQYAGYQPCELCLLRPAWTRRLMPACGAALAVGASIAIYHAGIEYHLWRGPDACTGTLGRIASAQALVDQLNHTNVIRCDKPAWTLFGVSMAGYNALASAAMAGWIFWRRKA